MSTEPVLSPSKITTYLACPVKFRWTYVDGRGKWYLRAKSYYSFGTTLHKVLERFHDAGDQGVTTTEEAVAAYEESWIDAGFGSADEMLEAFGEGKEILERHIEQSFARPKIARTVDIERTITRSMRGFKLQGRIDRIDEHDTDGALEIIDYKSLRWEVTPEDVETDIAMGVYQLLLKRENPDRRVFATLVALKSGREASYEMPAAALDQFEKDLQVLGERIFAEGYYEVEPRFKPICPSCDFLPLCRKHEEFESVA